jgi:hypothetical protein
VRRFTLITIIVLSVLIAGAAVCQVTLASRDQGPFPDPVSGTPLPQVQPSPEA